ncbi:hypothetical protein [Bacteroides finegoldii]|uniref:hypothetical protein n=1 Tax=Bacteroides finegoldii TaxID=338188 RepID=UPI001E65B1BE|nr:hypothetical protein [Bacteroides finegoldii]
MMKAHAPMAKNVIRIEISPAKEHTEHFTMKDWEKLWDDFVREYDSMEFRNAQGEIYSHRTNLAGSVPTVPSGDGGGTSNDLPWGRKEVEDEMERARRCARTAIRKLGKKPKSSIRR